MVSPLCFQKAQSFCNYFLHVCSKELLSFAYFQLLTDNVSYSLGNAGKKKSRRIFASKTMSISRRGHTNCEPIFFWYAFLVLLLCCAHHIDDLVHPKCKKGGLPDNQQNNKTKKRPHTTTHTKPTKQNPGSPAVFIFQHRC